jgi:hypothetical protein
VLFGGYMKTVAFLLLHLGLDEEGVLRGFSEAQCKILNSHVHRGDPLWVRGSMGDPEVGLPWPIDGIPVIGKMPESPYTTGDMDSIDLYPVFTGMDYWSMGYVRGISYRRFKSKVVIGVHYTPMGDDDEMYFPDRYIDLPRLTLLGKAGVVFPDGTPVMKAVEKIRTIS